MSVVITSDRLEGYAATLVSYEKNFLFFLRDKRTTVAGLPPAVGELLDDFVKEEEVMFWNWMEDRKAVWGGFGRKWKLHFFETNLRSQYSEDWIPPIRYTLEYAVKYSLPQYPQQRVKIPDPTDSLGRKRSIRVHFAENQTKR